MAEVELEQPVAQQRVIDGCPKFPRPLGLQVGVAATHALSRKIGAADEVIVKLVRNGDGDLNGEINADDFARLDEAWANPPASPSYFAGDLDYSGTIDADDFFMIDRAFAA